MANYDLAFTGAQIDSAIGKVQNAETSVVDSTNMVESAAVFTELNNLTTDNLAAGTLVTSSETFPDTDTTIPTCGAVKDFIDSTGANITPTIISMSTVFIVTGNQGFQNIPNASITSGSDIVSSGTNTFTIKAGLYFFNIVSSIDGNSGSGVNPEFKISASSGTMALSYQQVGPGSVSQVGTPVYIASDTALTIQLRQQNTSGSFNARINSYTLTLFRAR